MRAPTMITWMLIALLATNATGQASTDVIVADVSFKGSVEFAGAQFDRRGAGLLRYMAFIKAYAGALYLAPEAAQDDALATVPRRLEIVYFHQIEAEKFAAATRKKIAENVTAADLAAVASRLESFNRLYRDVQPGDRYGLTYIPERGTALDLNGRILGWIEGDDFARAVFSIWLGPEPIDEKFKAALLGAS